jgi:hypothetical protein
MMASLAGIGLRTLDKVEAGEIGVQLETLVRVSQVLGVSVCQLYPPLHVKPKQPRAFTNRWSGRVGKKPGRLKVTDIKPPVEPASEQDSRRCE